MDQQRRKKGKGWKCYLIWNSIRFAVIGSIVCYANFKISNEIHTPKYQNDCCNCYVAAMNETKSDPNTYRFDLSYCIPECMYCSDCQDQFYDFNQTCPINHHSYPTLGLRITPPSWRTETQCPESVISFTSLTIFLKSYKAYGVTAIIVSLLYSIIMCILLCNFQDSIYTIPILVYIYNYVLDGINSYLLFKAFQYQHITIDNSINCRRDSISNYIEDSYSAICYICVSIFILQLFWCCFQCCKVCKKGASHQLYQHRQRLISVESQQSSNCTKQCIWYKINVFCIIIIILVIISFFAIFIWSSVSSIEQAINNNEMWIIECSIVVDVLIILSMFDVCICTKNNNGSIFEIFKRRMTSGQSGYDQNLDSYL